MLFLAAFIFPQKGPKEVQTKAGSWEPRHLTPVAKDSSSPQPSISLTFQHDSAWPVGVKEALFWVSSLSDTLTFFQALPAAQGGGGEWGQADAGLDPVIPSSCHMAAEETYTPRHRLTHQGTFSDSPL